MISFKQLHESNKMAIVEATALKYDDGETPEAFIKRLLMSGTTPLGKFLDHPRHGYIAGGIRIGNEKDFIKYIDVEVRRISEGKGFIVGIRPYQGDEYSYENASGSPTYSPAQTKALDEALRAHLATSGYSVDSAEKTPLRFELFTFFKYELKYLEDYDSLTEDDFKQITNLFKNILTPAKLKKVFKLALPTTDMLNLPVPYSNKHFISKTGIRWKTNKTYKGVSSGDRYVYFNKYKTEKEAVSVCESVINVLKREQGSYWNRNVTRWEIDDGEMYAMGRFNGLWYYVIYVNYQTYEVVIDIYNNEGNTVLRNDAFNLLKQAKRSK